MLTAFSQRDLVERARDAGAMAYLVKPFSRTDLVPAIEMAVSRFAELGALEAEVADLGERLETRKVVDRAKGVLQEELGLSEPDAFRWIQKTAMDLRLSMREVADGVVEHGIDPPLRATAGAPAGRPGPFFPGSATNSVPSPVSQSRNCATFRCRGARRTPRKC